MPTVPFTYDFEDFDNSQLNIELKKLINCLDLTLPIVYCKKEDKYLVGTKKLSLIVKGQFIHYLHDEKPSLINDDQPHHFLQATSAAGKQEQITSRLADFIEQNEKAFKMQLAYMVTKSKHSLKKVLQVLVDGNTSQLLDSKELHILQSYSVHKYGHKKHFTLLDA